MKALFFIYLMMFFMSIRVIGQSLLWNISYPNGMNFSSTAAHDLDKNGIQELIIGLGTEDSLVNTAILLVSATGNIVWEFPSANQLYTQPLFKDINGDNIDDIFMGGRMAGFYAVDGSNGNLIWQFWNYSTNPLDSGWSNFYGGTFIPDVNNDGVEDILVSNGGDPYAPPYAPQPAGKLLILNTLNGQVLHQDTMPDGQPTYHAPTLYPNLQNLNNPFILLGSGGETLPGKFYKTTLLDLKNNNIQNAQILASDTLKGFISQIALADLNLDGHLDMIVPCHHSKLFAIDGQNFNYLWVKEFPDYELYSAPSIGLLNQDNIPDISILIQKGEFPEYESFLALGIDGNNGNLLKVDSLVAPPWQVTPACIIDWDQDGMDEALHIRNFNVPINQDTTFIYSHLVLTNFYYQTIDTFPFVFKGTSLFSQPLIRDIDNNGLLDLIFTLVNDTLYFYRKGIQINRLELPLSANIPISWAGYKGTHLDAIFINPQNTSQNTSNRLECLLYPNPHKGEFIIANLSSQFLDYEIYNFTGQKLFHSSIKPRENQHVSLSISKGGYYLVFRNHSFTFSKIMIVE